MFERVRRGREIGRACLAVLRSHPQLALYPAIAALAMVGLTGAIGVPIVLGLSEAGSSTLSTGSTLGMIVGILLWYFGCAFLAVFCNAALIGAALEVFAGRPPSVGSGFAAAGRHLPQILGWSALAATVGLLFRVLDAFSDKVGLVGQIIEGLAESAWGVVTYFVLPVVVTEGLGPVNAVKRSSSILRRTWGESLVGSVSIGLRLVLFLLPLFGVIAFLASDAAGHTARLVLGPVAGVYAALLAVAFTTLGSILRAALYDYASTGAAPSPMTPEMLRSVFSSRKK